MSQKAVAIVTGAASGIGLATAKLLASQGYLVATGDLNPAPAEQQSIENWPLHHTCDVRSIDQLQRLVEAARELGPVRVLVNNAGIGMVGPVTDISESNWDDCFDTNVKAAFFGSKYVIPEMKKHGGGAIVNIASNAGLLPRAHDPVYSSSKQALVGMTKSLALCLSRDKIRVNAVCPGPVCDTGIMNADLDEAEDREQTAAQYISASPLASAHGRMITPHEVAEAVAYLASEAACMITGTMVAIDGGKSLGVPPKNT